MFTLDSFNNLGFKRNSLIASCLINFSYFTFQQVPLDSIERPAESELIQLKEI